MKQLSCFLKPPFLNCLTIIVYGISVGTSETKSFRILRVPSPPSWIREKSTGHRVTQMKLYFTLGSALCYTAGVTSIRVCLYAVTVLLDFGETYTCLFPIVQKAFCEIACKVLDPENRRGVHGLYSQLESTSSSILYTWILLAYVKFEIAAISMIRFNTEVWLTYNSI